MMPFWLTIACAVVLPDFCPYRSPTWRDEKSRALVLPLK
jgi:hypothetical protein